MRPLEPQELFSRVAAHTSSGSMAHSQRSPTPLSPSLVVHHPAMHFGLPMRPQHLERTRRSSELTLMLQVSPSAVPSRGQEEHWHSAELSRRTQIPSTPCRHVQRSRRRRHRRHQWYRRDRTSRAEPPKPSAGSRPQLGSDSPFGRSRVAAPVAKERSSAAGCRLACRSRIAGCGLSRRQVDPQLHLLVECS